MSLTIGGIWEGFSDAIYNGLVEPIQDFISSIGASIVDFFTDLGEAIRNAIIGFVDATISFVEYSLNYIRQYLPYAIMITISWIIVTRAWRSEKLSFFNKIGLTIASPIIGWLVSRIFDSIVPIGVQLPRLRMAIQPIKLTSTFEHSQYTDESIRLELKTLVVTAEYNHEQLYYEAIIITAPLIVESTYNHEQLSTASIIIA